MTVAGSVAVPLAPGLVADTFTAPNIKDKEGLAVLVRTGLKDIGARFVRRAGLSLPDGVFRIQALEFDELPTQRRDRDRLVRWRLEKGAAFDASGTVLRYQAYPRSDRGCTVLACIAKQEIISPYEDLLAGLGLEPWHVAPSAFNAMNFYASSLAGKGSPAFAFVWVTESSSTTIFMDQGVPRFYRYKEIKSGGAPVDVTARLIRELDDSLHFYQHMDRQQQTEVGQLYLAGEPAVTAPLAESLKSEATLAVETLSPNTVHASAAGHAEPLAAAFGAGGALS